MNARQRRKPLASPPKNLAGMTRAQLQGALIEASVCAPEKARMRAGQLWRWIHTAGHTDFERMTDLSRATAYRLWTFARAWLHCQLAGGRDADS